jgi:TPR repeat protein
MNAILKVLLFITMLMPTLGFSQIDFEATRVLAEQGDADAQFNLGLMYANGDGVPQNDAESAKWFRLAAEQGDAPAQSTLGVMYANGEGVPQNHAEAVKWHRLAAEQGHASAQFYLGVMYHNGEGVPQNHVMAYVWESLAAAQGHENARKNRDISVKQLTPEQLARGQDIAARCFASEYKNCN